MESDTAEPRATPRPCLDGIRVLELGSSIAGPAAAKHLADFGAEVIKVEPYNGDQLRSWGTLAPDGTSWWFKSLNRGKRLVTYDVRKEADAAEVRALALTCDVVIENFRPGWLAAFGLDAASLRARKPALVYVSISGYGQDGPYAQRPGYGAIAESLGGFRHITGEPDGPPLRLGVSTADELAALYAALATAAALRAREIDGRGDTIDVSLTESVFSLLEGVLPDFIHSGRIAGRVGNRLSTVAPSGVYRTADDRWIALAGNSQPIFRRLATVMGEPGLADDERFADNQARCKNVDELDARVGAWIRTLTLAEADRILGENDIPAGPILDIAQIVDHPQIRARGAVQMIPAADGTEVASYRPVPRFRERPMISGSAAGAIGRDQATVREERSRT